MDGVTFTGFYSGDRKGANPFGIVLSGVTNANLSDSGLGGLFGYRSPGSIKIASLEATRYGGKDLRVAFDIDLYNPRSVLRNFIKHNGEVSFNGRTGFTTQVADVARALRARRVISGVTTR